MTVPDRKACSNEQRPGDRELVGFSVLPHHLVPRLLLRGPHDAYTVTLTHVLWLTMTDRPFPALQRPSTLYGGSLAHSC